MKTLKKSALPILFVVFMMTMAVQAGHIPTVPLGTASSFAVLAGAGVTNSGPTTVKGDLGSHPNGAVTGFPPGIVTNGTINPSYTADAKDALVTAYNTAAGSGPTTTIVTELDGQTLIHGVYNSEDGTFGNSGTLTLNAGGDPNAVWIFKAASSLTTAAGSNVLIINSPNVAAASCNIFWQVGSSATLGSNSTLRGNILAMDAINMGSGATVFGRALARVESVTLISNNVDASACLSAQASPSPDDGSVTPTPDGSITPSPDGSVTPSPDGSVTPSPDGSITPTPDGSVTPTPDGSVTPTPDGSITPTPASGLGFGGNNTSTGGNGNAAVVDSGTGTGGGGGSLNGGRRSAAEDSDLTGQRLAETGLALTPVLAQALALIAVGIFYCWLAKSQTTVAVVVRGYQPRHRARKP